MQAQRQRNICLKLEFSVNPVSGFSLQVFYAYKFKYEGHEYVEFKG